MKTTTHRYNFSTLSFHELPDDISQDTISEDYSDHRLPGNVPYEL